MPRLRRDFPLVVAVLSTAGAAVPVAASAQAGGTTAVTPAPAAPATAPQLYGPPGVPSLVPPPSALMGRTAILRGTLPRRAGRRVTVQWLHPQRGWRTAGSARVRSDDRYLVRWKVRTVGLVQLRTVLGERRRGARSTSTTPAARLTVYRAARATWYGPDFYGKTTACGQVLTPLLLGVAHRELECGTLVQVSYAGRTAILPVVDRGPFRSDVDWDLTGGAAAFLGFEGLQTIGVIPGAPPPPAAPAGGAVAR